jgi:diaminopimelate decarboxylase
VKKPYVPPTVVRHEAGTINAQAQGQTFPTCTEIDGTSVTDLLREFGSPLYVFSERTLRETCRSAMRAFTVRYPDVRFAWSYKTNYLRAICAVFHQEGSIAEVVSDFEYDKARAGGVAGHDILYNGPHKSEKSLERALDEGAKIQIDNFEELGTIVRLAESRNRTVDVAIRVFMECGASTLWSKFGFDADGKEAMRAIAAIRANRHVRLVGLHTHVGTHVLDPEIYSRAAARLVELAKKARHEHGIDIKYLNLGGGFASPSRLHGQQQPTANFVPTFDEYAEAICGTIRAEWSRDLPLPRLYLETGRALVDDAGYLLSTIVAMKNGAAAPAKASPSGHDTRDKSGFRGAPPGDGPGVLVDAGVHLLHTSSWFQYDIRPARAIAGETRAQTVYGCLCMNIDVLRQGAPLPSLQVGDALVFHPVGAYNLTQSMQFITYRPAVVMVTEDGTPIVIREREDLAHVEALERLPKHLRPRSDRQAAPVGLSRSGRG